ncbi:hypothetical protein B0H14DRAFT_2567154 [Mycena olivaceomarginata]|nr:hypothetical protein B0H14DRAFT_2567154 [Mycena olivaceomarginata]
MPDYTHHATTAASMLKQLSELSPIPYLKVVAGVSLLILETIQTVKTNKEQCATLVEQVDELLCVIIELCVESVDNSEPFSPLLLNTMGRFAETLQKIESFMRKQQDMGRIQRFFRQQENTVLLEDCKEGLRHALDVFTPQVKSKVSQASDLVTMRATIKRRHEGTLLQDSARIAFLGPGSIGKTSLAKSALYHAKIVDKYDDRYFVSCESAATVEDLILAIATTLGFEISGRLSKTILAYLATKSRCFLILDNFETPWESAGSRPQVESFLALLTDIPHLALLVTMREQERPLEVRLTRAFLPPLQPLSSDAARKTFVEIADADEDNDAARVSEILALTGNLPLAVTLMANVASFDGSEHVLARWKMKSLSLLSDGYDKETNLETSLRISLSSPRMTPDALQLLGLLSILPDGVMDSDLLNSKCSILELPRCKSTLVIKNTHPPSYTLVRRLRSYWDQLLGPWRTYALPSGDLMQRPVISNIGNITNLLTCGLVNGGPNLKEIVYDILYLNGFVERISRHHLPLLADLETYVDCVNDNQLRGLYVWCRFDQNYRGIPQSVVTDLVAEGGNSITSICFVLLYAGGDMNAALKHCDKSLSLGGNDDNRRHRALRNMAMIKNSTSDFCEALALAGQVQNVAGKIGNFHGKTDAIYEEARAWIGLGNFAQGSSCAASVASGLQWTLAENS